MSNPPAQPQTAADEQTAHRYTAQLACTIEPRWQQWWADRGTFAQPNPGEPGFDASKPKYYCLDMFPYPSGAGLHVGHPEGYTATDIICRYKKMCGFNVLHPMGWDAFGLPAEQYAIQTGVHPEVTTKAAVDNFRRQLQRFGFCYDWDREFGTIDPDYYAWTQWIFLQLYKSWFDPESRRAAMIDELVGDFESGARPIRVNPAAAEHSRDDKARTWEAWASMSTADKHLVLDSYRLAYLAHQTVNWCPKLGTALANEEVIDGRSERGGFPVLRKPLRQWMLRITAYADRLLADLPTLDWPNSTKRQQAEWIGRSEGAQIDFVLAGAPAAYSEPLRVFTTRPDTVFGATYMVVAPEHPLVDAVLSNGQHPKLAEYVAEARNRPDVDRQESKEKTGVDTGVRAINPATGELIPVWAADYVLMGYGTGAIMAVPAHDQRDYEFAKVFGLPILDVIYPTHLAVTAYYAQHSIEPEKADGDWKHVLANLIGYVISNDTGPEGYADAMEHIRRNRRGVSNVPKDRAEAASGVSTDLPGAVGERRGVITTEWLESIDRMGFATLNDLWACLTAGAFFERDGAAFSGVGTLVNSANEQVSLDALAVDDAKARIIDWLEANNHGTRHINFRLRDWLFSRQRYWGEPFPIVFDEDGHHHAVSEESLPVVLPPLADYAPVESDDPQPLLGKATDWINTTAGEAGASELDASSPVTRESNTMPGWAGSCWYFLRYTDSKCTKRLAGRQAERYWMLTPRPGVDAAEAQTMGTFSPTMHAEGGVDLYIGGSEHAVLHLLYARFWHKLLFDLGEVSTPEPFQKLFHQGLITSFAYQRPDKSLVPVDEVEERDGDFVEIATGEKVAQTTAKMSKSLKNVVNPDDVIAEYGADTFRLYEMYMGPLEASKPWNTKDTIGLFRFCQKAWRLLVNEATGETLLAGEPSPEIEKALHRATDKVGTDIESLAFNTAIAALFGVVNTASGGGGGGGGQSPRLTLDQADRFCRILGPFAPHLAEEMWHRIGRQDTHGSIADQPWPEVDPAMLVDDEIEIPVQVLGKLRSRITLPAGVSDEMIEAAALDDEKIKQLLVGKTVRKVIVVSGRLVNIVAN
ncbi:MAG: leucyl-tRNA synthetase [Phycisphaerales bacterium]|jgi:leucyl-tRNA synthetase